MEDKIIMKKDINHNNENSLDKSAVLDLYSRIDVEVNSIKKVNTGICISLPENIYVSVKDISSLASKGLLTLVGFIDRNYSKEIIVTMTYSLEPIKIKKGQKIARLIISNKKS